MVKKRLKGRKAEEKIKPASFLLVTKVADLESVNYSHVQPYIYTSLRKNLLLSFKREIIP